MVDLKRLFVLLLMKGGASQTEIARALGVNKSTISRQFRLGAVEPFLTGNHDDSED